MSDNSSDQLIPSFVGQYRRKRDEKIPQIVIIDSESEQSRAEKSLCNFFKCTKNWGLSGDNEETDRRQRAERCFATRNTILNFEIHLKEKHSSDELFCVYCHEMNRNNSSVLKLYSHRYLMKHMLKRHRLRRFQCNQCLYRAITEEHLIVHQKRDHEELYPKSISAQTNDEKVCKIFLCQAINCDIRSPNLQYFYRKYRFERFNSQGMNETLFQCLYCAFMAELLPKVVDHCHRRHPDYPILYYIPEPQISSSTNSELVNDFITFDNIAIVRPKLEPQDNSVSSTQKSPDSTLDTNWINGSVKRKLILEDKDKDKNKDQSSRTNDKRVRVDANNGQNSASSASYSNYNNSNQTLNTFSKTDEQKRICLFCDNIFIDDMSAKTHIESHFADSKANNSIGKEISDWIQEFILKQHKLCSFEETEPLNAKKAYYCCPVCQKLAKIRKRVAKRYATYRDVRQHLWQHCCWLSVKCRVCAQFIPNSDPIIAKHLTDNHKLLLNSNRINISRLLSLKETEFCFGSELRLELEKTFIEVNANNIIENSLKSLFDKTKEDFEHLLRVLNNCHKFFLTSAMPRLSNSDSQKYLNEYIEYENRKKCKTGSDLMDNCSKKHKKHKSKKRKRKERKRLRKELDSINRVSNKTKQRIDNSDNFLGESSGMSAMTSIGSKANNSKSVGKFVASTESAETNANKEPDSEDDITEEYNRISCYHCNDKFKNKKQLKEHHQMKHRFQVMRFFAKHRKPSDN